MKEPEDDILKQFGLENDPGLRDVLAALNKLEMPASTKEEAWARFEQAIPNCSGKQVALKNSYSLVWGVAASFLVLVMAWWGFTVWNNAEYVTANNEIKQITLPDQSKVTLNAASKLGFKKWGWKSSRKVNLAGEALFEVVKGNKFEISTLGKTIRILGTEFNVFSRVNFFEVKCISGQVGVSIPGNDEIILIKGKAVKVDNKDQVPVQYDVQENTSSWINGDFYFDNARLEMVFEEISRQFNVYIVYQPQKRRYTGYFNKMSLEGALKSVCLPMGLTYTALNDSVLIE